MKYSIAVLTFLFLLTITATVMAATTSSVSVSNNVNSTSNSSCTSHVENHITVEVNGEKKTVDDVKDGCNVNNNIKVEAKSEDGKTTINITGSPQSVKSESTQTNTSNNSTINTNTSPESVVATSSASSSPSSQAKDIHIKSENLIEKIMSFFTHLFASFKFWR